MTAPDAYDAAAYGITRARERSCLWHEDQAAEFLRALAADGLSDDSRAFLAAQREWHDNMAAGLRKAMEAKR